MFTGGVFVQVLYPDGPGGITTEQTLAAWTSYCTAHGLGYAPGASAMRRRPTLGALVEQPCRVVTSTATHVLVEYLSARDVRLKLRPSRAWVPAEELRAV